MTLKRQPTYHIMAVRRAPQPTVVRQRDADWHALLPTERENIVAYQRGDVPSDWLTTVERTFMRRHSKEEK